MCPVWFDEFSLRVGAKLRESIERGLKEATKCVLILTPHFLANIGWTNAEFNAVFTRELVKSSNVVLPVWCDVTRDQVYEYSPALADRMAVQWSLGVDEVFGVYAERSTNRSAILAPPATQVPSDQRL